MSILSETQKEINSEFPELYKTYSDKTNKINNFFSNLSFKQILLIFLCSILIVFLYTYFNFEFLNILDIDFNDTIKILTPSVITLVSMNLFVTNLLLTHLKDDRDDLEKIITKKVHFKFITYFGFAIVFYLLVLIFTFKILVIYKTNILILLFYSFLIFIFLLINLYKTVFEFINKTTRKNIIAKELKIEFENILYVKKVKKEFRIKYNNFFKNNNFTLTTSHLFNFDDQLKDKHNITVNFDKVKYFRDIRSTELLKHFIKIKNKVNYYTNLELDEKTPANNDLLLISIDEENNKLSNYFIYKDKPMFEESFETDILNILLKKIDYNVSNNKLEDLKEDLSNVNDIFEKFLNTY
ncbi:hypothetical protein L1S34_03395 [Flavobacterium sp. K77]|uniref:hypothetical protein n=1 Tax=Flavobacterium sp. K77 TaxID=2910676 RepID=UPI001F3117DA|nr:hypothetical protein [Flavobacterium sp. K77]MCF6140322.1 hypothetical protein [Flavobacterium sp. K77]